MQRFELDDLDRTIIGLLTEDGRLSASEIAATIGSVSERTVRNRIAALLQSRMIVIGAIPDPTAMGREVQADVWLEVEPGRLDDVAIALGEFDEVGYLAATSGRFNLTGAIFVETHAALLDFCETVIASKLEGMARWREALFAFMLQNANGNLRFFNLPLNRVIELGTQVEM